MRSYGREGVVEKIRAEGGEIYAITSEPQRLALMAKTEWEFDFESIGDPHHEISGACEARGWLKLFVNKQIGSFINDGPVYAHPKGHFQPGVLALDSNGRVLYRWRGVPTRKNMGGATERPVASYVFEKIIQALDASDNPSNANLDNSPELDSRGLPWPVFVSLLTANGWFIKPKPFPYLSDGPTVEQRAKRAVIRIPFFVAAWATAFVTLPTTWVGVALLGYAAWLTPHIRQVNRYFQNEQVPET